MEQAQTRWESSMTLFDDNKFPSQDPGPVRLESELSAQSQQSAPAESLAGDPISYRAHALLGDPIPAARSLLRSLSSLPKTCVSPGPGRTYCSRLCFLWKPIAVGIGLLTYYSIDRHLSQNQIKKLVESDQNSLWHYGSFGCLDDSLPVHDARGAPRFALLEFAGWRKIRGSPTGGKGRPWIILCPVAAYLSLWLSPAPV